MTSTPIATPVAFLLALVVALLATPVVRQIAIRLGVVDLAGVTSRKIHATSIPRMGGAAVVLAFLAPLLGLLCVDSDVGNIFASQRNQVAGLFLGSVAICALGIIDDTIGVRASRKLLVQLAIAVTVYLLGFRIERIALPFDNALELGVMSVPVTIVWITGLINAMNLIDGLDGLAAGVAFFATLTTFVIAVLNGNILMMLFMATLGGALLGFLFYNFNPAKIFLGDTGSMFLGFIISVTTVQTSTKSAATVALLTPIIALGIPIADTLLAMVRRTLRGRPMFRADREHIHHRLIALGLSHRNAVLVIYGVSLALGAFALAVAFNNSVVQGVALGSTVLVLAVFMVRLGYWSPVRLREAAQEISETRRANALLKGIVRDARAALNEAQTMDAAWSALADAARRLEVAHLALTLDNPEIPQRSWEATIREISAETASVRETANTVQHGAGRLEFVWNDRDHVNVDTEAAARSLGSAFVRALRRLPTLARRKTAEQLH